MTQNARQLFFGNRALLVEKGRSATARTPFPQVLRLPGNGIKACLQGRDKRLCELGFSGAFRADDGNAHATETAQGLLGDLHKDFVVLDHAQLAAGFFFHDFKAFF